MRPEDERYFERIDSDLEEAFAVAREARAKGKDPEPEVEIPVAEDMADRVENILGIPGVAERVRELEGEMSREEAALVLAEDFAEGRVGEYETDEGKIEGAVRTAVALLTEGVVAAPIEGIDRVEVCPNDDGTDFVRVYYAGPIRSAGGTAQALSVLVADYARSLLGVDRYKPREEEVERYAEEVGLYDEETGLQYTPKDAETKFIARHCPIMLDGEATGDEEVSGYRNLERIDTNSSRGGMCLVLAEGIALKAPKIERYTADLDEVDWPWLDDLMEGTYKEGHDGKGEDEAEGDAGDGQAVDEGDSESEDSEGVNESEQPEGPPRVESSKKFLRDLIAGRPVFGHPSEAGGFRLRYGRARNHGHATAGVHPATMRLVEDFLAPGTQLKTELPGKAAGVVPVDSIEGPTVRLANGDVRRIDDPEEAMEVRNGVEAILDLGEYLVNYGEFVENNHELAPASYAVEWWEGDMDAAGADVQALRDDPGVNLDDPTPGEALRWARAYDAPLHPTYTYLWHDIPVEAMEALAGAIEDGEIAQTDGALARDSAGAPGGDLVLPRSETVREALEALLVEHTQQEDVLVVPEWRPLASTLGFDGLERDWRPADLSPGAREYGGGENAIRAVNEVAPFEVRERAPTRIGGRMGRPEKSEERELSPAVHTLFPIGEAGGDQRDVAAASKGDGIGEGAGQVEVEVARRRCPDCDATTYRTECPDCGAHTEPEYRCPDCEVKATPDEAGRIECPRCGGEATAVEERTIDVHEAYHEALDEVGERENTFEILKGVKGLSSAEKTPEPIEKGILRAKHDVSAFKDGTVRYDMTDLPVTAVKPDELDVTADQLRALGYEEDVHGDPLRYDDQVVHLKVQDVVLSEDAADHMLRVADFVDDLLVEFYDLEPFYEVEEREDLVGELVFGMAPHTSAATVGRVVGFTSAAVGYAHPYFHAAKRRNCFHPDARLWFAENGEWRYESVETLVEGRLEDPEEDDLGTLVQDLDGEVVVPSLADDGACRRSVEAVSKHPAPDHLVRIETTGGTVRVTPDHTMLRESSGGIAEVAASEIDPGDRVPMYDGGETTMTDGGSSVGGTPITDGDSDPAVPFAEVTAIEIVESEVEHVYCLTVADTHRVAVEGLYTGQCDGDEDCVMLLLDGLLNFSDRFLPDKRGGKMDAPLVMSSRIDPSEIDDEAHNVDIAESYPREFFEATRGLAEPDEVDIRIAEDALGTEEEYACFGHTHETTDIARGPDLSAYKTLGSMEEKMEAQLELARRLRAVDETDVAERIIEYHFLPDLIGNLRAFSRQETRCLDCGEKYRRPPLTGDCRECGGDVNLTVHEGSVNKYMDTAMQVAEEYGARDYTKQRLEVLERSIERIFENDKNRLSTLGEFM